MTLRRSNIALTKAGAWIYDINNQEKQYLALEKAYAASSALLGKYTLRAPRDGVVLSINTIVGAYVSPQGAYNAYTQGFDPILITGESGAHLNVRCYVDEILVSQLPPPDADEGTDDDSRNRYAYPAHFRSHPALCLSQDRAI